MLLRATLLLALYTLGAAAASQQVIAWSIQKGNGCSASKTIGTYYYYINQCHANSSDSYMYACSSGGAPLNVTYSGTGCQGTALSTVALTTSCYNVGAYGYTYACVNAAPDSTTSQSVLIEYDGNTCGLTTADPLYFVLATNGQCLTCVNGEVTVSSYAAPECTGTPAIANATANTCLNSATVACGGNSAAAGLVASVALLFGALCALLF